MKLIKFITPGIVVRLPHNNFTVRTPYIFQIEDFYVDSIKTIARIKGIQYEIESVEELEVQKVKPNVINRRLRRKGSTKLKIDLKIGGGRI